MEVKTMNDDLAQRLNAAYNVTPEQTGCRIPPNGVIPNCKLFPCDTCDYYYGELNECMREYSNI